MTATASSYARANLIGEHTDYNNGFVLPTPLPFETTVTVEKIPGDKIVLVSHTLNETSERAIDAAPAHDWTDYVMGCVWVLRQKGIEVPGLKITIDSNVPMGAGISSSAALLVATLRALRTLLGYQADDKDIAMLAHKAEREFAGVPCGMMDQFVCALGQMGHAFMFDTQAVTYKQIALPKGYVVMLVHCGKKHRLASGDGYRQRVAECQEACKLLGVKSLRELSVSDLGKLDALPDLIRRRAKHVITENQRVLDAVEALAAGDMPKLAELMAASHDSQRDDYEVSIPEIDALVESSRKFGLRAARLTGGGFGGSIVGLVPEGQTKAWWDALHRENPDSHLISTYGIEG